MELWYFTHPLVEDIENNLKKNSAMARELAMRYPNRIIFSSLEATSFMREPEDREMRLRYCKAFLETEMFTGIILPYPEWMSSERCKIEYALAFGMGMKIDFIDSRSREVYRVYGAEK